MEIAPVAELWPDVWICWTTGVTNVFHKQKLMAFTGYSYWELQLRFYSAKKERGYENVINIQIYAGSCGAPDDGVARCCCFVFVGSDGDRPDMGHKTKRCLMRLAVF